MKKLIVSMKPASESLSDFKKSLKKARKGKFRGNHFEISFDNKKDFDRFAKNMTILSAIVHHKPKSVYELAKILKMDVSNLNKLILFFESLGAIRVVTSTIDGRAVKTPVVEYQQIEFDLNAA